MKYHIFSGKNCLVTGASGGIGKHIAMKFAENECNLFLSGTNGEKLRKLKEDIESVCLKTAKIFYDQADLNKVQDIYKIIELVRKELGSIDILIHCAGVFIVKPISDTSLEDFESTFNLNLKATFLFCKEFSHDMVKNKWGRIINIGSSSAYSGAQNTSLYCASKHAVLGFSRALHEELKCNNVRVYCISPAGAKTEMGKLIPNQNFDTFINPHEIADYVLFISSYDGDMVSDEIRLNRMIIR